MYTQAVIAVRNKGTYHVAADEAIYTMKHFTYTHTHTHTIYDATFINNIIMTNSSQWVWEELLPTIQGGKPSGFGKPSHPTSLQRETSHGQWVAHQ